MMWAGRCGGGKRYCRSISPSDKAMTPWARHTNAASVLGRWGEVAITTTGRHNIVYSMYTLP